MSFKFRAFIHLFRQYLLNLYYVPISVLGTNSPSHKRLSQKPCGQVGGESGRVILLAFMNPS